MDVWAIPLSVSAKTTIVKIAAPLKDMNPITHFLAGWAVANIDHLERRERAAVAVAGIVPDLDAAGIVAEKLTLGWDRPLLWWTDYHHILTHNVGFCTLLAIVVFVISRKKWLTVALAVASFHLHLIGDLIGARGPDGHQWPIPYFLPFSDTPQWAWSGQWAINAWPNIVITLALLGLAGFLAWRRGFSFVDMVSPRADAAFVAALRARFGTPTRRGIVS